MGINRDSKVVIGKTVSTSEIDNEKVMVDFETGKYFMIKGVGNDIWERVQTEITVSDLIDSLLLEYDIDEPTCEKEVIDFLDKLNEYGFLKVN